METAELQAIVKEYLLEGWVYPADLQEHPDYRNALTSINALLGVVNAQFEEWSGQKDMDSEQ